MPGITGRIIKTGADLLCHGLPSKPVEGMGKILVTGASGYIGGRLIPELLARGYAVRAMVRGEGNVFRTLWPDVEVVEADALVPDQVRTALEGVEVAYYLIHSMLLGPGKFEVTDLEAAHSFRTAAEEQGGARIIYLGGLGDIRGELSSHLQSRMEVAEELDRGMVPVTVFRAAVIIGSGSASYEIIEHLIKRARAIPLPRWSENRCQPISIRDVVKYLVGALETPATKGRSFDIGGPEVLSYKKMLIELAKVRGKKIAFFQFPLSGLTSYAYIISLLTPVPLALTRCLMEGLENEVVCQNDDIRKLLPFKPLLYREAVLKAMGKEALDRVDTRWSDAYPPRHNLAVHLHEVMDKMAYVAKYSIITEKRASGLFMTLCRLGGKEGWFHSNWMWRLRGLMDKLLTGVGTARGRKRQSTLQIGDVIDFWRVEDLEEDRRLLLRAEMLLPGHAWLEFEISKSGEDRELHVTAHYNTRSIAGKLYWYSCLPFHRFIFRNLLLEIEKRS